MKNVIPQYPKNPIGNIFLVAESILAVNVFAVRGIAQEMPPGPRGLALEMADIIETAQVACRANLRHALEQQ